MSEPTSSPCGASTTVPVLGVTAICELALGHQGPHHGYIAAAESRDPHDHPWSYDWADGRLRDHTSV